MGKIITTPKTFYPNGKYLVILTEENPSRRYKYKGAIEIAILHFGSAESTLIPVDENGKECWMCPECGLKSIAKTYWENSFNRTDDVISFKCDNCSFVLWDKEKLKKELGNKIGRKIKCL